MCQAHCTNNLTVNVEHCSSSKESMLAANEEHLGSGVSADYKIRDKKGKFVKKQKKCNKRSYIYSTKSIDKLIHFDLYFYPNGLKYIYLLSRSHYFNHLPHCHIYSVHSLGHGVGGPGSKAHLRAQQAQPFGCLLLCEATASL